MRERSNGRASLFGTKRLADSRPEFRRRLQPRAVAGTDVDPGHRVDAPGPRVTRHYRRFLLGQHRTARSRIRLRLAGSDPRAARWRGNWCRSGHTDRSAADLAAPAASGDFTGRSFRPVVFAGWSARLVR